MVDWRSFGRIAGLGRKSGKIGLLGCTICIIITLHWVRSCRFSSGCRLCDGEELSGF